jgi:hypothetical protein
MTGWLMNVEQLMEWDLAWETEVLEENLFHCHFFHHKSHMTWPGTQSRQIWWETRRQFSELCHNVMRPQYESSVPWKCPVYKGSYMDWKISKVLWLHDNVHMKSIYESKSTYQKFVANLCFLISASCKVQQISETLGPICMTPKMLM